MEIRETYVNATDNCQFGDSGWYEPYQATRSELFRSMQHEYGGCKSRMYIDRRVGKPFVAFGHIVSRWEVVPTGWVFGRRERYEDARPDRETGRYRASDYYTREVWVQVREG